MVRIDRHFSRGEKTMKSIQGLILLILLAFTLTGVRPALISRASAQEKQSTLNPKTRENVMAAMKGEAYAYARYMMYADHARQNGHPYIADLFERTAKTEHFEHFRELAALVNLPASDVESLQDAIQGETYESQTMYPAFAKQAEASGDTAAAERFRELAQDEAQHRDAFRGALNSLQKK
jgi:rubrerythrin